MPAAKLPVSLILLVVSLILSVLMMRGGFERETLYALAFNAAILFATRFVAKNEDSNSVISIFMCLGSLLFTAIIIDFMFAALIVIALDAATIFGMRHMAKMEAFEAQMLVKRHP
jgi:hypothetical protein